MTDTFKTQISDLVTSVVNGVIAGLKSTISSLEKENSNLRKKIVDLGIPKETNEDTDKIILGLASTLNVDMELADINRSHRVGYNCEICMLPHEEEALRSQSADKIERTERSLY